MGRVFICNPGSSFIEPGTEAQECRCGHVRAGHWWGGGNCGEYIDDEPCGCEFFVLAGPSVAPEEQR